MTANGHEEVGWQVRPLTASPHDPSTTEREVLELLGGHDEIWDELLLDLERRIARSETRDVEPLWLLCRVLEPVVLLSFGVLRAIHQIPSPVEALWAGALARNG